MGCSQSKDGNATSHKKKHHHVHAPAFVQIKSNDGHKHNSEHHDHVTGKDQDHVFLNHANAVAAGSPGGTPMRRNSHADHGVVSMERASSQNNLEVPAAEHAE